MPTACLSGEAITPTDGCSAHDSPALDHLFRSYPVVSETLSLRLRGHRAIRKFPEADLPQPLRHRHHPRPTVSHRASGKDGGSKFFTLHSSLFTYKNSPATPLSSTIIRTTCDPSLKSRRASRLTSLTSTSPFSSASALYSTSSHTSASAPSSRPLNTLN